MCCKTKFGNIFDSSKNVSSYIARKNEKGEMTRGSFELRGMIDETFGRRSIFGKCDGIQVISVGKCFLYGIFILFL